MKPTIEDVAGECQTQGCPEPVTTIVELKLVHGWPDGKLRLTFCDEHAEQAQGIFCTCHCRPPEPFKTDAPLTG